MCNVHVYVVHRYNPHTVRDSNGMSIFLDTLDDWNSLHSHMHACTHAHTHVQTHAYTYTITQMLEIYSVAVTVHGMVIS